MNKGVVFVLFEAGSFGGTSQMIKL